jgi:type IV secretion system protein VirB9
MKPTVFMWALLLCTGQALAYDVPGWSSDSRVRQLVYQPDEVVRIDAQRGFATHIALDPKEHILVVAPGDRDGWQVVAQKGDHDVYLKPELAAHDSNLEIRTDRRSYSFDLVVLSLAARFDNDEVMYRVTFAYPQEADSADAASKAEQRIKQAAATVEQRLVAPPVVRNAAYSMQVMPKSSDIAPTAAWDDGRFTDIRIPDNRRIPAVFRVDDHDDESVVDTHMDGDTVVVHEIAKRFVLRLGDEVVGLWNDAYDVDGAPPKDGTTVDGVKRVLRSDDHDQ